MPPCESPKARGRASAKQNSAAIPTTISTGTKPSPIRTRVAITVCTTQHHQSTASTSRACNSPRPLMSVAVARADVEEREDEDQIEEDLELVDPGTRRHPDGRPQPPAPAPVAHRLSLSRPTGHRTRFAAPPKRQPAAQPPLCRPHPPGPGGGLGTHHRPPAITPPRPDISPPFARILNPGGPSGGRKCPRLPAGSDLVSGAGGSGPLSVLHACSASRRGRDLALSVGAEAAYLGNSTTKSARSPGRGGAGRGGAGRGRGGAGRGGEREGEGDSATGAPVTGAPVASGGVGQRPRSASKLPASSRSLTAARKRAASAPSISRWSYDMAR